MAKKKRKKKVIFKKKPSCYNGFYPFKKQRDEDPAYVGFRKRVLYRDGYRCQFPGCSSHSHLEIHHIKRYVDFPNLRVDTNNGITLCKAHHVIVTGKEDNYELMFYNIVINNKKEYELKRKKIK